MRGFLISLSMLVLGGISAGAQHYDRGYDSAPRHPFVTKGTWVAGGILKYTHHINKDYKFLIVDNINSTGYSVSVNPELLYTFKDNMSAGIRFSYDRNMTDLRSADLAISEIAMSVRNCYSIRHRYSAYAVYRPYIQLAGSRRLALYADLMLGGSFSQAKAFNAGNAVSVVGTYGQAYSVELAVNPGVVAFLSDRLAVDLNIGIFGASYSWSDQVHNQAATGDTDSTSVGFMLNMLSIGVGLSYYFL